MRKINLLQLTGAVLISAALFVTACKKKDTTITPAATSTETGQSSSDNRDVQNENDAAVNDMNDVIGAQQNLSGRSSSQSAATSGVMGTYCGFTIDTINVTSGSVVLNYNGTTCNNRTRTGSIRVTLQDYASGKRWKDIGCIIKVEYLAYKVVRASDQKSIQLDGTQYLTNESGGTWWQLLIVKTQTSLVSTVTGTGLHITFNDGKTAVYNINRRITYTYPNNILTCQAEGIGTSAGLNNLENYGTTRDGDAFTSQVSTPLIWNITCGSYALLQGNVTIKVASQNFELNGTFGVNASGTPVTVGANSCPYGWKLDWTVNGQANSKIFGYL